MRFSVIVPVYNKSSYVTRTIKSVLAQTYRDFELIVVDDGSNDDSVSVAMSAIKNCESYCKVVKQSNSGVAVARNHGVELARGEYVCFLDSDDWWEPAFLDRMSCLIESCPDAGLYGTGYYICKNGKKRIAPIGVDFDFKRGYINYCQVYARTLCMPITSSSVTIPRSTFLNSGKFRKGIKLGEDFDLWIRLALTNKVALLNEPLADYFQDVPVRKRATRKLHKPEEHMLWNLDYLMEEESRNPDLKILMDRLRASGLFRFYLSKKYHGFAMKQLMKIDWNNVPDEVQHLYFSSLRYQRLKFRYRAIGSAVKQFAMRLLIRKRQY